MAEGLLFFIYTFSLMHFRNCVTMLIATLLSCSLETRAIFVICALSPQRRRRPLLVFFFPFEHFLVFCCWVWVWFPVFPARSLVCLSLISVSFDTQISQIAQRRTTLPSSRLLPWIPPMSSRHSRIFLLVSFSYPCCATETQGIPA